MIDSKVKKALLSALLVALFCWSGLFWLFERVDRKRSQVKELAVKLENQSQQLQAIKDLSRQVGSLQSEIDRLDDFFVGRSQAGVVNFIELTERLALRSGVQINIEQVTTGPRTDDEMFEWLNFKLQADGEWSKVFDFFKILENLPYRLDFERLDLTALSEIIWRGRFSLRVLKLK